MLSRLREFLPQASSLLIGILLAVLAVLVLAWVIFGIVRSSDDQGGQVADQEMVAQSQDDAQDSGADSPAPEAENRNVDSYAAYEAKDPFRQIVEPADSGSSGDTSDDDADNGSTSPDRTGTEGGIDDSDNGSDSGSSGIDDDTDDLSSDSPGGEDIPIAGGGGRGGQGRDSDRDGVSNKREQQLDLDPTNPDTDSDGIRDGADDSNGDGRPDRDIRGGDRSGGRNGGSEGNGDLFDSGGSLLPSGK